MFQTLSKNEREFMLEAINADCRVDARTRTETRLLKAVANSTNNEDQIRFGQENGQCMVNIGQTKVVTQSVLKIISPKIGKPNEGEIKIQVEFTSLGHSAEFNQQTSTLSEMRIEISNFIDKVLKSSRATDREGLCIIQGKLAWSLTVELQLINDDGNLVDAFFLAAILALKNTRLPEVSMRGDEILVSNQVEKQHYINVHHLPICTTFFFIPNVEGGPIVDANSKEERLATARLSICMNVFEDVCGMQTLGQLEVDPLAVMDCAKQALKIAKETTAIVRRAWDQRGRQQLLGYSNEMHVANNQTSAQQFINNIGADQVMADSNKEVQEVEVMDELRKGKNIKVQPRAVAAAAPQPRPVEEAQVDESAVVSSGKRKKQALQDIQMTDPKELDLAMAVKKRERK